MEGIGKSYRESVLDLRALGENRNMPKETARKLQRPSQY